MVRLGQEDQEQSEGERPDPGEHDKGTPPGELGGDAAADERRDDRADEQRHHEEAHGRTASLGREGIRHGRLRGDDGAPDGEPLEGAEHHQRVDVRGKDTPNLRAAEAAGGHEDWALSGPEGVRRGGAHRDREVCRDAEEERAAAAEVVGQRAPN